MDLILALLEGLEPQDQLDLRLCQRWERLRIRRWVLRVGACLWKKPRVRDGDGDAFGTYGSFFPGKSGATGKTLSLERLSSLFVDSQRTHIVRLGETRRHERLGEKIARRAASSTEGGECESDSADDPARRGPRQLRPIVKAILAFKQLQADAKARREASKQAAQPLEAGTSSLSAPPGGALAVGGASAVGGAGFKTDDATVPGWVKDAVESGRLPPHDQLALSEEQLEDFFVDESSGLSILDIVSPRTAQVNKPQPPPLVTNAAAPTQV